MRFRWRRSNDVSLLADLGMDRTRLRLGDLFAESASEMLARPGRTILTTLGTVLGVGTLVVTIGIAQTLSNQVSGRFDALRATQVSAIDLRPDSPEPAFPSDTERQLEALNGVLNAGELWIVADQLPVATLPFQQGLASQDLPVYAATPGALSAAGLELEVGRQFDDFHYQRAERVAILGSAAADRLGVHRVDQLPAVFIADQAFVVIGVASSVNRRPDLNLGVVIPGSTANATLPPADNAHEVLVEVEPGAGETIGQQLPLVLGPHQTERYHVTVPPDPKGLRTKIEADLNTLFFALAGIALAIGVVGIANTTLVAVLERTPEFGLRRAVGARPKHIALQVLAEAAVLGTAGGLIGLSIGALTLLGISVVNTWTAVLDPRFVVGAPIIGTLAGLIAGLYPAWKTSRIQPVDALRR
jgi:putative ABC transport system permease protein